MHRFVTICLSSFLLVACGGGGGSGVAVAPGGGGDPDSGAEGRGGGVSEPGQSAAPSGFAERSAARGQLLTLFHAETGGSATRAGRRPMAGQAVHQGFADITLTGGPSAQSMNGDLSLVVNFGQSSVLGRIEALRRSDETPLAGTLYIRDGRIGAAGAVIQGRLEGTLTEARGALDFDARVEGDFFGPSAEYSRGRIAGPVQGASGVLNAEGGFLARR